MRETLSSYFSSLAFRTQGLFADKLAFAVLADHSPESNITRLVSELALMSPQTTAAPAGRHTPKSRSPVAEPTPSRQIRGAGRARGSSAVPGHQKLRGTESQAAPASRSCLPVSQPSFPLTWALSLKPTWEKSSLRGCSANQQGNHAVLPEPAMTLSVFLLGCIAPYFSERKQPSLQSRTDLVLSVRRGLLLRLGRSAQGTPGAADRALARAIPARKTGSSGRDALPTWERNGTGFICASITSKGPLFEFFSL